MPFAPISPEIKVRTKSVKCSAGFAGQGSGNGGLCGNGGRSGQEELLWTDHSPAPWPLRPPGQGERLWSPELRREFEPGKRGAGKGVVSSWVFFHTIQTYFNWQYINFSPG